MKVQVEPKVQAATGGASVAALVCWALTHWVWHGALPVPVEGLVDVVVPGVTALLGGYFTPHRPPPSPTATLLHLPSSSDVAEQAAAGWKYIRDNYAPPTDVSATVTTPDPARPAVAEQQPAPPNPEGNTSMSLLTEFEALAEDLRGKVIGKVGAEVSDEIHAAFDVFKGQGAQLLTQLGHDAQADATTVAADVAQVATDAASAVAPTEAAPVAAEPVPAPTSSPETPAAPTA